MEYAYNLDSPSAFPFIRKYQINATVANPGIPMLRPGAGNAGIALGTTISFADFVGVNIDIATYVTAQQTDGSSAERKVSVIINPGAVYKCKLSGGAAENTALTLFDVTTAASDGLSVTTGDEWSSPSTYDEGIIWAYDGANVGQQRKITSVSSTAATVTVAFDYDTVVGDNFMRAPYWYIQAGNVQLTTNLYQADATIAVGTGGVARVVDMELRDISFDGRNNSFIHMLFSDNTLRETT